MAEAQPPEERRENDIDNITNCPICCSQMNGVSVTHCGHRFCTHCILQWLERHENCPKCRGNLTDQNLIEDRDFDELIRMFNRQAVRAHDATVDSQEQQPQQQQQLGDGGTVSLEDVSHILQSVMPQRDQDLRSLTDNLLEMKTREIGRLEATNRDHIATVGQLRADKDRLQDQIDNEVPGLRDRVRELQEKVERKRGQKQQLKDKIRELETNVTEARTELRQVSLQKDELIDKQDQLNNELQEVKESQAEIKEETVELKMEIQSYKDEMNALQTQLDNSELSKAQTKEWFDRVLQQKQVIDVELFKTKQQCLQFQQQALQLQKFESLYTEKDKELKDLKEQILPAKDIMILQMQAQTSEFLDQLAYYSQNTIPMHQHVETLQSELQQTLKNLKKLYDDEYGSKITRTEHLNETLQKRVGDLENELRTREDAGDELKTATRTYKKLLKENSDFRDAVNEKDKQIKRLQHDLARSKERTNTLERKISLVKDLRED